MYIDLGRSFYRMKKIAILFLLLFILLGCTPKNKAIYDSQNNVYVMDVYLDTQLDTLTVEGELYYKNDFYDLEELYINIYPNAINPRGSGYNIVFEYFKINGQNAVYDITGTDHTVMHVPLLQTLTAGERISITYKYSFEYWSIDRIVTYHNYYLTLFFYPYVAIYDQDGWNIEPYTFRGEVYYNTIGDYYVTINVPEEYLVASSGALIKEKVTDLRKTLEYSIKDARDFSFSASSDYRFYERTIDDIEYQIYAIRDLSTNEIEDSFSYLSRSMEIMERSIGEYFYDHFTLEYGYFYGMESTGVIYCSNEIQEATVVHEMIHQWFYSMIGNDQANESFLDEALTTYTTSLYFYDLYGINGYNEYLNYRSSLKPELSERYEANIGVSLLREVDEYGDYYGYLIYYHGPSMFRYYVNEFLDGNIDQMINIFTTYYQTYNKSIATLNEFLDLMEQVSGIENTKEWFYLQLNEFQDFDNRP